MQYKKYLLPFLFLTAFLLRMVFVPNPGFEADMAFWKSWGLAPYDHGILWSMFNTNNNYPTPFAYLLWFVTAVYSLFANPHAYNEFWSNTNTLFLTLMKLPAVLADLGIAGILLWFTKKSAWGIILASLYLFSPISILDSAVWGQVDSLGVFLFLLALVLVLSKKPFLAGAIYMVALMTKLQNMIYGPLFFLFIWQALDLRGLVKAIAGSVLFFFLLNIEFLLTGNMARVITSLTANYDYFPYLSLNAYNIWWMVAKGNGMGVSDKILTIGIINAKTMGLILFASTYFLAVLHQLKNKTIHAFFTSLVVVVGGFFFFQTQSHDRYLFPAFVFGLFWMFFFVWERLTTKERGRFWTTTIFQNTIIGYILLTILYFLNLHTAFVTNYPNNGIQALLFLNSPSWTIPLSVLLTVGYLGFLVTRCSHVIVYVAILLFAVIGLNTPLIFKKSVPVTSLAPIHSEQQYGQLTKNMPVNAKIDDWKTWDRLSTQYFFYSNGLGTHANSKIVYHIGKRFTKFTTDYGIDTEAGGQASVVFEIYGDDTLLFRSDVMKRYDYPKHTEVEITGVNNLMLVVTDAQNGNIDDHADWLNPILTP
jgi:Gpi18-like mannosyltransferase